jgi:hypothetical protein
MLTSSQYDIDEEVAKVTVGTVWNTSRNIRDSIKIASTARSLEDVDWLVTTFLRK